LQKSIHRLCEWVTVIDSTGKIRHEDWGEIYYKLRLASNTTYEQNGYLLHEAVLYDPRIESWLFLPRKVAKGVPYDELSDERLGGNILLIMDKNQNVRVVEVGPLDMTLGFTDIAILDPDKGHYIATKALESQNPSKTRSYVIIFDLDGNILSNGGGLVPLPMIKERGEQQIKYEGIEIVQRRE
jgi:hypothetical protein